MEEHPVQQPIRAIDIYLDGGTDMVQFFVGAAGVTRIEACQKSGLYGNLPYVRVWKGDTCLAEFCQHNIVGVYFAEAEPASEESPKRDIWTCPDEAKPDHNVATCDYCIPF